MPEIFNADYYRMSNAIQDALMLTHLSSRQSKIMRCVERQTLGWGKQFEHMTASIICKKIQYSGPVTNINSDIRKLKNRSILITSDQGIGINFEVDSWQKEENKVIENDQKSDRKRSQNRSKTITKKKNDVIEIDQYGDRNRSLDLIENDHFSALPSLPLKPIKTTLLKTTKDNYVEPARQVETPKPEQVIFQYWQTAMGRQNAKPIKKRIDKIKTRLGEGYTVEDIKQAIDGCKSSPHHMGKNKQRKIYDDLELICRSGSDVERFKGYLRKPSRSESSDSRDEARRKRNEELGIKSNSDYLEGEFQRL